MTETLRDLWPEDGIETQILTPWKILEYQAGLLGKRTSGLLRAEVHTSTESERVRHTFEIIAPALDDYRYQLFVVSHQKEMVYPVSVIADCLHVAGEGWPLAATQDELLELISKILNSKGAKSVIQSLVARINEVMANTPN